MTKKKVFGIGLLVIAVVCLVFSILCFNMEFDNSGSYEIYKTYGADFYTDVQHAAAHAANAVEDLAYHTVDIGNALTNCAGYGFIVMMLVFVTVGLYFLLGDMTFSLKVKEKRVCASCGQTIQKGTPFCTKCGAEAGEVGDVCEK